jgi:hypothetical protein
VFTADGLYMALASPTYFMMPEWVPPVMNIGLRALVPSMIPFMIWSLSVVNMSECNSAPVTVMMTCPAETCHAHSAHVTMQFCIDLAQQRGSNIPA